MVYGRSSAKTAQSRRDSRFNLTAAIVSSLYKLDHSSGSRFVILSEAHCYGIISIDSATRRRKGFERYGDLSPVVTVLGPAAQHLGHANDGGMLCQL
jgi:hypothetical protein